MILIDHHVGSRELLNDFRNTGVQAELAGIDTDFQFVGNGPEGDVLIGIERKVVADLAKSMRNQRLAGSQVGRIQGTYDVYSLVIEGLWRKGRETGYVEVPMGAGWGRLPPGYRYSEIARFLMSLNRFAGLSIWRTPTIEETVNWIVEEYHWWHKPWKDHRTANALYVPEPVVANGHKPVVFRRSSTLVERWVAALPGIDSRASDIAKNFLSAKDMATADLQRWLAIAGLGKHRSNQIITEIEKGT